MKKLQRQKGFTLVELAIVLTIIGILIGGILKGQQLINNARVTAQIAQFQSIQAAETSFQDAYAALPGDLAAASTRVPGLGAGACAAGGTGLVGAKGTTALADSYTNGIAAANVCFWGELGGAGYLAGITTPGVLGVGFGGGLPVAKLGAGLVASEDATAPYSGLYVTVLQTKANPVNAASSNAMLPTQAAQIDRKMDDGNAVTGSLLGTGFGTNCNPAGGVYIESSTNKDCDVSYQLQ